MARRRSRGWISNRWRNSGWVLGAAAGSECCPPFSSGLTISLDGHVEWIGAASPFSMNRPSLRQVLECGSPLPLSPASPSCKAAEGSPRRSRVGRRGSGSDARFQHRGDSPGNRLSVTAPFQSARPVEYFAGRRHHRQRALHHRAVGAVRIPASLRILSCTNEVLTISRCGQIPSLEKLKPIFCEAPRSPPHQ